MSTVQCDCWCGNASAGAAPVVGGENVSVTTCSALCAAENKETIGCYTLESQWPSKSELCWTETECSQNKSTNTWDDDVPYCYDKPLESGYCYSAGYDVNLIEPFGGNTSFSGLSEYVSAAYQFLVPVAAMLAVVFLMVGGAQYIVAHGNMDQVKKARGRMVAAVTGLVLLMSAWTVASIIDLNLVHQRQLEIPLMKKAVLLDSESTCETLASYGFGIASSPTGTAQYDDSVTGDCMRIGYVVDVAQVDANVVTGSWEEGAECLFSTCPVGQACTTDGCSACTDAGTTPSSDVCASMSQEEYDEEPRGDKYVCEYLDFSGATYTGATISGPACAGVAINCSALRSADRASCRLYDELSVQYGTQTNLQLQLLQGEQQALFTQICQDDPCELSYGAAGCQALAESTGYQTGVASDCISQGDAPEGNAATGITGGTCYSRYGEAINCLTGRSLQ